MTDYTKIVLLCEDRQQEVFARQFLESCGVDSYKIYPDTCPKGKKAGEQYVRENYPKYVKSYRMVANRLSAGLVVLTDADELKITERLRKLTNELKKRGVPQRSQKERIGLFIPKRNIETWIKFLEGKKVDEKTEYPHHRSDEAACKPHVHELARNRRQPLPDNAPESLKAACRELPRIFPNE